MIEVRSDHKSAREAKNLQTIIDNSYLSSIEQNLVVYVNNDQVSIENQSTKNPYEINVGRIYKFNKSDIFNKIFVKKNSNILDCTGGLCRDALKLERLGHNVTVIEENPIIVNMLRCFLNKNKNIKINLLYGNSFDYLKHNKFHYDYIYIDTMFDNDRNKSKPKKEIEVLRYICQEKIVKKNLIKLAIDNCTQAVITKEKRQKHHNFKPNFTIQTKLIAYNIYKG